MSRDLDAWAGYRARQLGSDRSVLLLTLCALALLGLATAVAR